MVDTEHLSKRRTGHGDAPIKRLAIDLNAIDRARVNLAGRVELWKTTKRPALDIDLPR